MIREHCCAICTPKMNIKICWYCRKRLKRISEWNYLFFKNFKNWKIKFYICEKCFKEGKENEDTI